MNEETILKERVCRFQLRKWASEVDAFLVVSLENIRYLTGFSGTSAVAFFTRDDAFFSTDFRYRTQSAAQVKSCKIIEHKKQQDFLVQFIREHGVKKLGIEAQSTVVYMVDLLRQSLPDLQIVPYEEEVEALRLVKDGAELESIKKAVAIAKDAFDALLETVGPGALEHEAAALLEYEMKKRGSDKAPFDTIVASGIRGSMPHGRASSKAISTGDLVTIDFGACCEGYNCDITRTVQVGGWSETGRKVYKTVLEAQRKAINRVRPGASTRQIDAAARDHIKERGYGEYFGHGTGHGVGLAVHEAPRLNTEDDHEAQQGMVFTIEPGIYIPDWGGVRIEDMVLVTAEGCEVLTEAVPKISFDD